MTLHKVLVVEDETHLASMLADALSLAQFEVFTAHSQSSAFKILSNQYLDIILIDLHLPDGNGLDLARQIRGSFETPVVMMSGKADDIDRILGLEIVADDYLQKPFSPRELIARLRAILRRNKKISTGSHGSDKKVSAKPLSFHGFILTHGSRELTRTDGVAIELTTREFDVLYVMATNRGKVMSRQEIYLAAGIGKGQADRQVDGLVSRLRTKLYSNEEGSRKIRTIHGRGYVLVD